MKIDGADCDDVAFWLAGDAAPPSAAIARHLEGCAGCRELVDAERRPALHWIAGLPADALADRDLVALPTVDPIVFDIDGELARGGMGRVLRARDRRLARDIALKEVLDPAMQARFEREVAITARLQHPAIVPIYEAGRWPDGAAYYAMRLVTGGTLATAIAKARTLEARLALLPHVLAVTDALAYAHAQRIVHRDLKPGNVLVGEFGETLVIDWGLAKELDRKLDDAPSADARVESAPRIDATGATLSVGDAPTAVAPITRSDLTVAGAIMGTPGFMSPEQATGAAIDERTDVYALGAILYNVLSGHVPHHGTGDTTLAPAAPITRGRPAPLGPRVPVDLQAIVARAMAPDRAARFANAQELAEELRRFEAGQLLRSREYTTRERVARWVRRHRTVVAITAIASVALAALAIISVRQTVRGRDTAERALAQSRVEQARQLVLAEQPGQAAALLAAAIVRTPDDPLTRRLAALALRDADRRIARFTGTAAAFSADGQALAIADAHAISIIDPATGAVRATLDRDALRGDAPTRADHEAPTQLAYAGATLVVTSPSRVELIQLATRAITVVARGAIIASAVAGDQLAIATTTEIQLLDREGRIVARDPLPDVRAFDVSPDATRLLALAPTSTIAWTLPALTRVASLPAARSARFATDGSIVLADRDALRRYAGEAPILLRAGEAQPLVRLSDGSIATGTELVDGATTRPLPDAIASERIAGIDATHAITGGFDRAIRVARFDLPRPLAVLEAADTPDALLATATRAVTVGHGGAIELWDVGHLAEPVELADLGAPIERVVVDPRSGAIATWLHDDKSRVALLAASGARLQLVDGWPVGFCDGALAVNLDGRLRLYATRDGAPRRVLADAAAIQAAAFSPSGARLATAAAGRITVRDAQTWMVVRQFDTRRDDITAVALDDRDRVVTGHDDGALRFWTGDTAYATAPGHRAHVEDLAIDGERLLSIGWDRTTRAWDIATGTSRGVLLPSAGGELVRSAASLATTDGATLAIWSARDGRLLEQRQLGRALGGVAFASDDRVIVGAGTHLLAVPIGAPPRSAADIARLAPTLGWQLVDGRLEPHTR